jgi:hypothetical protein
VPQARLLLLKKEAGKSRVSKFRQKTAPLGKIKTLLFMYVIGRRFRKREIHVGPGLTLFLLYRKPVKST